MASESEDRSDIERIEEIERQRERMRRERMRASVVMNWRERG